MTRKVKIEDEIEKYIMFHDDKYPTKILITQKAYNILNREVKKEYAEIHEEIGDITSFRGIRLTIDDDIEEKFIVQ